MLFKESAEPALFAIGIFGVAIGAFLRSLLVLVIASFSVSTEVVLAVLDVCFIGASIFSESL